MSFDRFGLNKGLVLLAKYRALYPGDYVFVKHRNKKRPTREVQADWVYYVIRKDIYESRIQDKYNDSLQACSHAADFVVDDRGEILKCRMAGPVEAAELFEYNEMERILYEQRNQDSD